MSSRDIWSKGGGDKVQHLLGSFFALLLAGENRDKPLYLCSPYLSDFAVLDNSFGQYRALFSESPELAERATLRLSEVLSGISKKMPVRVVTIRHPSSKAFLERLGGADLGDLTIRIATDAYHEKGLLCDEFYIEGSMNFTYSGVFIRDEKVACHIPSDAPGRTKIDAAFLEFNRLWARLGVGSQERLR
jgi:hypothetical protein